MLLAVLMLSSLLAPDEPIHVERRAPTTQVIDFDPAHPPAGVNIKAGEDALTRMLFNCTVKLKYDVREHRWSNGKVHVKARIGDVRVVLELTNKIYVPKRATDRLRAHEQGHARINGIIYEDAESAAYEAARAGMNRVWEADGTDVDSAGKAATDKAVDWICREYLKHTADKAFRIGEIFDDITQHGANPKPISEAIQEAIQKQSQERRWK
jgi:hypothetical protein